MMGLCLPEASGEPLDLLCLGAHADDIEIGCGGTVLELLDRRPVRVRWVVFSGEGERAEEARRSAGRFLEGADEADVSVHAFDDGLFPAQRREVKAVFERFKDEGDPDLILVHDEDDRHQDHRILGALCRETFRDHLILGYEIPKYDGGLRTPNVFAPLDAPVRERKMELILDSFPSQRSKHWFDRELFDGLMRLRGVECASPTGYAEGFHCRALRLDLATEDGHE